MTRWFRGIDFANSPRNRRTCFLMVENGLATPVLTEPASVIDMSAVDCPFGTTVGFFSLLQGNAIKDEHRDEFKTRETEGWLRDHLWKFRSNEWWQARPRPRHPQLYVNKTAHVKPTLGLQIVPGFLSWFYEGAGAPGHHQGLRELQDARLGRGSVVEAHPRAFLYSAIERVFLSQPAEVKWKDTLSDVATYKVEEGEPHARRQRVCEFLQRHSRAWLWSDFRLSDVPADVTKSDHCFDAFLAALTAFAHADGQTIGWSAAGLSEENVKIEGHILILSTPSETETGQQ